MALQVQLIQVVTGLVIACATQNFVVLMGSSPTNEAQLWNVLPTSNEDNNFYLCNVLYGTCLGSFHKSIISDEPLVVEDKSDATGNQLTWHYNSTLQKIVSSYYTDKIFVIDVYNDKCPYLVFYENIANEPTQNFTMSVVG